MTKVGAYDAKRKFSALLQKVEKGSSFVITNRGKEIARILPMQKNKKRPVREIIEEILNTKPQADCSRLSTRALQEEGRR